MNMDDRASYCAMSCFTALCVLQACYNDDDDDDKVDDNESMMSFNIPIACMG